MVVRIKKKSRKYLGNRSWGAGNIKNKRGAGDRGGVGRGGVKHKFTYTVKYERERLHTKGFFRYRKKELMEINLGEIEEKYKDKQEVELLGYKVLGAGSLSSAKTIKANSFSKKALEKIKSVGGKAQTISSENKA